MNKLDHKNTIQATTHVISANVSMAKASHMARPKSNQGAKAMISGTESHLANSIQRRLKN